MLSRAQTWCGRRPVVADSLFAAALLAISVSTLFGQDVEPHAGEFVASVLLIAPLALRRRAPVATFAAVMVACAAELVLVDRFLAANLGALVALYTLVAYTPRRVALYGCIVAFAGTIPFALHFDDIGEQGLVLGWVSLAGQLAVAALLGDRRRVGRVERAAIEDRARALASELEHQAALATALERERIARELHDVVGHALAVVVAQADGGRYAARSDPDAATTALGTIAATARDALAETRRAVGALRDEEDGAGGPPPLRPAAGAGDLRALVARTREAGLTVELDEHGEPRPLAPGASLTVYRVTQEALTNVLKHAGPHARASVDVRWEADAVTLVVRDDGAGGGASRAGRELGSDGTGRGLAGMRARVEPRGGTLTAGPLAAGGFEVRARIPTEPAT